MLRWILLGLVLQAVVDMTERQEEDLQVLEGLSIGKRSARSSPAAESGLIFSIDAARIPAQSSANSS